MESVADTGSAKKACIAAAAAGMGVEGHMDRPHRAGRAIVVAVAAVDKAAIDNCTAAFVTGTAAGTAGTHSGLSGMRQAAAWAASVALLARAPGPALS